MNVKENIKNLEAKLMQLNSLTNIKPEIENDSEKIDRESDLVENTEQTAAVKADEDTNNEPQRSHQPASLFGE